jgi:hypothetical protein
MVLKFTAAQMQTFSETQVDRFVRRTLTRLREFFPETRKMSDEEGHAFVRQGIEQAATYDIISEKDVSRYVGLMVVWGRDFDRAAPTDSWVASTLRNDTLDPGYKLELLYDHAARGGSL